MSNPALMFKHVLFAILMLACTSMYGQLQTQYPWEFGLQLGTSGMGGDMTENDLPLLNTQRISAGLALRRRIGTALSLRLQLMYGNLESDDADSDDEARKARGFSSETDIVEPGLIFEFEPLARGRFGVDGFRKVLSPYLSAGVAYGIWGEATTDYNNATGAAVTQDMQDNADEKGGIVFPLGIGLKYYISPRSSLGLDFSMRITGNDLIDGVSASGNPDKDDTYGFMGLTFYTGFGKPDSDKDGIVDELDACPEEAGPESTMGCPDTDGDGVADKDDACPDVAGLATLMGCPDGDGDGVADKDDACPTEAGLKSLMGCPDGDGDGVADKDDACPTEAGLKSLMGCPDGDGDGIADKDDECPTEAGIARFNGCPDSDGDGIPDKDDACPNEAGVASRDGCPLPKERAETLEERIARYKSLLEGQEFEHIRVNEETGTIEIDRIYFPTDVHTLNRPDRIIIEEIDRFIKLPGAKNFTIRYEGHADRRASEAYNQRLSERRANSAEQYTIKKGGTPEKLSTIGFGENRPVGETLRENRVVISVASEPTLIITEDN